MTTRMIHVSPVSDGLPRLAMEIYRARNITVLAGAGISTDAGLPDFHSRDGLYADGNPFTLRALSGLESRRHFMKAALALYLTAKQASPTPTHKLIRSLHDTGQLRRLYSQNVDGLEDVAGLQTDLASKSPNCVLLHGSIRSLRCELCCATCTWDEREKLVTFQEELYCPQCVTNSQARVACGKRRTAVGILRPAIVCSDESHPQGERIETLIRKDECATDLLIVLGTSLKFDGPERLARRLAKAVHRRRGTVIYVNATKPHRRASTFIDYWVGWRCDHWVHDLQQRFQRMSLKAGPRRKGDQLGFCERIQPIVPSDKGDNADHGDKCMLAEEEFRPVEAG